MTELQRQGKFTQLGRLRPALYGLACAVFMLSLVPQLCLAEEDTPKELEGVGITERLGEKIDPTLVFKDYKGRDVVIGDLMGHDRPLLLTLNYYHCPMLCSLQLNGLTAGLRKLDWTPGQDYELMTLSFDPDDTVESAEAKRDSYIKSFRRLGVEWSFMVGDEANVGSLLKEVGMQVKQDKESLDWAHPAVAILVSPEGVITRYLYGINFDSSDLKLGLLEASKGKIGNVIDQVILTCFQYDPTTHRYVPFAMGIMRAGGTLTAILLFGGIFLLWRRERKSRKTKEAEA